MTKDFHQSLRDLIDGAARPVSAAEAMTRGEKRKEVGWNEDGGSSPGPSGHSPPARKQANRRLTRTLPEVNNRRQGPLQSFPTKKAPRREVWRGAGKKGSFDQNRIERSDSWGWADRPRHLTPSAK